MPGPAAGESDAGRRAGPGSRCGTRSSRLAVLLALGLALRLIIAYVLLPGSGFEVDLGSFSVWALELARNGPWGLYDRPIFVDYTPGYLYVLWALGLVTQALGIPIGELLKLPAIVADLALALASSLWPPSSAASRRRRSSSRPASSCSSRSPGSTAPSGPRSTPSARSSSSSRCASCGAASRSGRRSSTTIAAIIKPQFGILIPLAAVVIIRRHWVERPDDGSRLGGGPIRILTTTLVGLVTATLVCLPFGITILGLVQQIVKTAGGYPYVTVNAYNPWALVSLDGAGLAASGTWIRDAPNPATRSTRSSRCSAVPPSWSGPRSSAPRSWR